MLAEIPDLKFTVPVTTADLLAPRLYLMERFPRAKSVELTIDGRGTVVHAEVIESEPLTAPRRTFHAIERPTWNPSAIA